MFVGWYIACGMARMTSDSTKARSGASPTRWAIACRSRVVTALGICASMPSERSVARRRSSFSSSGWPCTRYSVGVCVLSSSCGHGNVGEDHALLDQAVRIVAYAQLDRAHPLARVDDELRLRRIEVQSAAARARLVQRAVDIHQHMSFSSSGPSWVARGGTSLEQRLVGLRVGEPRRRAHDRRVEARTLERTVPGDHHVGDEAKTVDVRRERAQVVGQRGRQHRHDARRKIDRRAALCASVSSAVPGRT